MFNYRTKSLLLASLCLWQSVECQNIDADISVDIDADINVDIDANDSIPAAETTDDTKDTDAFVVGIPTHAVHLESAVLSMQLNTTIHEAHPVRLTMFRDMYNGLDWQAYQCYKLSVTTPYRAKGIEDYHWLERTDPPECAMVTSSEAAVDCQVGRTEDDLLFLLTEVKRPDLFLISLEVSNFINPWSATTLEQIELSSYVSPDCSGDPYSKVKLAPQSFYPIEMPSKNVSLESSSDILGDSRSENTLTLKFTPESQLPKDGSGLISLRIPNWYTVAGSLNMMFDEQAVNTCTSSDFKVTSSVPDLISQRLQIRYEDLPVDLTAGVELTVSCAGFKNPIYEGLWDGFQLTLYDAEESYSAIEVSQPFSFDSYGFKAAEIDPDTFEISPIIQHAHKQGETITWAMSLSDFPIPLETECYIKLQMPPDLDFFNIEIVGEDMFKPFESSPMTFEQDDDEGGSVFKFPGCLRESTVGFSAKGILLINAISSPKPRKDTGYFYLEVYKDAEYTSIIANLTEGKNVKAHNLESGMINDIVVTPTVDTVQIVTDYTVSFITSNDLYSGSDLTYDFPTAITLPEVGSEISVETLGVSAGYLKVNKGLVQAGNRIFLDDVFGVEDPPEGPIVVAVKFLGLMNPKSAIDAGEIKIEAFYRDKLVDSGVGPTFTPSPGLLQNQVMKVVEPVTSALDSNYKLTFSTQSEMPVGGYFLVTKPETLELNSDLFLAGGSCIDRRIECEVLDEHQMSLRSVGQDALAADTLIVINIEGFANPRSTEPFGPFLITTFDSECEGEIDTGYEQNTELTELAEITLFEVTSQSGFNGAIATYDFRITTSIAVVNGDYFTFSVPEEVGLPTNEDYTFESVPKLDTDGKEVFDEITVSLDVVKRMITITFNALHDFHEGEDGQMTYEWTFDSLRNPYSEQESGEFSGLIAYDESGFGVQEYRVVPAPTITNTDPAQINIASFLQNRESADDDQVTFELTFVPTNPIPSEGSFVIEWPEGIYVPPDVECTVENFQSWKGSCIFEDEKIIVKDVFFSLTGPAYTETVSVTLVGSIQHFGKDMQKQLGPSITTYADVNQEYRIDHLTSDVLTVTHCRDVCQSYYEINRERPVGFDYSASDYSSLKADFSQMFGDNEDDNEDDSQPSGLQRANENRAVDIAPEEPTIADPAVSPSPVFEPALDQPLLDKDVLAEVITEQQPDKEAPLLQEEPLDRSGASQESLSDNTGPSESTAETKSEKESTSQGSNGVSANDIASKAEDEQIEDDERSRFDLSTEKDVDQFSSDETKVTTTTAAEQIEASEPYVFNESETQVALVILAAIIACFLCTAIIAGLCICLRKQGSKASSANAIEVALDSQMPSSQQTTERVVTNRPMVDEETPEADLRKVKNPLMTLDRPQEGSLESAANATFDDDQAYQKQKGAKKTMKKKLLCQDDDLQ